MKIAYITGATGCIGRNLIDQLVDWDVTVLHRKTSDLSRLKGCNVKTLEVDLYDLSDLENKLQRADVLFHVAANVSHWKQDREQQWKDNVLATRNLVTTALNKGIERFIFTSTGATLGYSHTDEYLANQIKNNYISTKRLAELEIYQGVKKGLDAVILNPIICVGKYDLNNYSQIFQAVKTKKFNFVFPGSINFCSAEDIASAHVAAYFHGVIGEHYVPYGTYTTWLDFYQRIAALTKSNSSLKVISQKQLYVVALFLESVSKLTGKRPLLTTDLVKLLSYAPDVTFSEKFKIDTDLRYQTKSLDEMILDCYNWMKKEGKL